MVDALGRRNTVDSTRINTVETPTVTSTTPQTLELPDVPRTHTADTQPTGDGSLVDLIRESPTTRAVILGAGGLASLFAGSTAHAATVNVGTTQQQQGPKSIVYVGMNEGSQHEVESLRARLGQSGVTYLHSSEVQGQIKHAGKTYDLNTAEGRLGFASAIGLPSDKAQALASILEGADDGARDEAAQLARTFRDAEKGKLTIERIVLSGHSIGSGVWGDGNGYLQMDTIAKLALLFPQAAGQVQDLMMAACYSGGQHTMEKYQTMFPNLRSVWAYDGSAPGSYSGAVPHILRWEKATRNSDGDNMSRNLATGTRKGENVAVWTATKGYNNGKELGPIETDRAAYDASHANLAAFVSGENAVTDSQTGPLREHYNSIQRMLGRNDLPASERTTLSAERDLVIRLLYYKNVGTMFQTTYKTDINAAFQKAGLPAADFSTLSRKDAIAKINELEAKLATTPGVPASTTNFVARMHSALIDLNPAHVPAAWL